MSIVIIGGHVQGEEAHACDALGAPGQCDRVDCRVCGACRHAHLKNGINKVVFKRD